MTSIPSKKTDLSNISQSTYVQERGLVHRARNREDEGSGLWISSWFRLLSLHLPWGKRENGHRGGPEDVHFYSCIWNKTMGCFLQAISYLCLQTVPSEYTVKARARFTAYLCTHYQHRVWCSMRHLNITADTVSKKIKFLAQKQWQRLKVCQDKNHSSLPSKWTKLWKNQLTPTHIPEMNPRHTIHLLLITA